MKKIIATLLLFLFFTVIFGLSLRGISGNPTENELNSREWKEDGPLELSPDRGRYALTYSVVENNSVSFSVPLARFATPDLGYKNGNYVSLFAPGVSYIVIPGYLIGRNFDIAQVGTFAIIALFAVLNGVLIRQIAMKLGVNAIVATIASFTFLFATPAFAYGVSLYQHHISTFLILCSLYLLLKFKSSWALFGVWMLAAVSLLVDYPNFFMMAPIALYALTRLFKLNEGKEKIDFKVNILGFFTVIAAIIPMLFFLWFNQASYGSPFQLAGTVPSVKAIDESGNPTLPQDLGTANSEAFIDPDKQEKTAVGFFQTRSLLNGFYTHFISPDRGIIFFTPVILFGILGLAYLYKSKGKIASLFLSLIGVNIILYSLWGDPWGGWAFGSRYLIPSYALLSVLIAVAFSKLGKKILFSLLFLIIFTYSVLINTAGALTTNANPPKVEGASLDKITGIDQKYSFDRNFEFLQNNDLNSFIFQEYISIYLNSWNYYTILCLFIILPVLGLIIIQVIRRKEEIYV
jgi:hypothetical protein